MTEESAHTHPAPDAPGTGPTGAGGPAPAPAHETPAATQQDGTAPGGSTGSGEAQAAADQDRGWTRWMPRRRTAPATAADAAASGRGDAGGGDAPADAAVAPADDASAQETGPIETPAASEAKAAPRRRRWGRRRPDTPAPAAGGEDAPADGGVGEAADTPPVTEAEATRSPGRLRRRRRKLLRRREEAVYHLGGLAFELHRRDMLGEEVMRRRAGEIAEIDAAIHDIDLRLEHLAAERRQRRGRGTDPRTPVGCCLGCRAPFQVDARFCWQCGTRLAPVIPDADDQQTAVIVKEAG